MKNGGLCGVTNRVKQGASMSIAYPFTAIVGQDDMRRALTIAAVDPGIGGVLVLGERGTCLLYTSPSPRDGLLSRMPSSA